MSARIRHLALYTENQNWNGEFLQNRVRHETNHGEL